MVASARKKQNQTTRFCWGHLLGSQQLDGLGFKLIYFWQRDSMVSSLVGHLFVFSIPTVASYFLGYLHSQHIFSTTFLLVNWEAWEACSHRKVVAASAITAVWYLSSLTTHILQNWHLFSTTADTEENQQKEKISVTFVEKDGEEKHIKVPVGMSILEAAHQNDIELEGACKGSLACSTCHVILMDINYYNKLEDPSDEENDMLDLAFGLTETSRLGCQVIAKPELDGIRLALPPATRNFAVDGHVPKPH